MIPYYQVPLREKLIDSVFNQGYLFQFSGYWTYLFKVSCCIEYYNKFWKNLFAMTDIYAAKKYLLKMSMSLNCNKYNLFVNMQ